MSQWKNLSETPKSSQEEMLVLQKEMLHLQKENKALQIQAQGVQVLGKVLQEKQEDNVRLQKEVEQLKYQLNQNGVDTAQVDLSVSTFLDDDSLLSSAVGDRTGICHSTSTTNSSNEMHDYVHITTVSGPQSLSAGFPSLLRGEINCKEVQAEFHLIACELDQLIKETHSLCANFEKLPVYNRDTEIQGKLSKLSTKLNEYAKQARTRETLSSALVSEEEQIREKLAAMEEEQASHESIVQELKKKLDETREEIGQIQSEVNIFADTVLVEKGKEAREEDSQPLFVHFGQTAGSSPSLQDPLHVNCWQELQDKGILRTALVDHVFADFIEKGLLKQDILEMMEDYGLIAKFSSEMSTSENEEEPLYFVPTQLTSSPSELFEIKPSKRDPCPLFVHFLDGFVPHGLFPQFVSRCISWCSENGFKETPKLFNNGARFLLGKQIMLALICRKRFIKVVLKRRQCPLEPSSSNASNKMAVEVRTFIERTLNGLSQDHSWLRSLRYELSVACTHCLQSGRMSSQLRSQRFGQDDSLHLLKVLPCGEVVSCVENFSDETVTVPGLEEWFVLQHPQNEEQEMNKSSEAEALDPSFPCKSGTPSRGDVLLIAHELGAKWKMLGRVLEVSDPVLEQIEEDNRELSERCYKVLIRWQEKFPSKATYQRLAQALQHPTVDRAALAVKYCEKKTG